MIVHYKLDVLRLLHLWFRYGDKSYVAIALAQGFLHMSIDTWLSVIPQIKDQFDKVHMIYYHFLVVHMHKH